MLQKIRSQVFYIAVLALWCIWISGVFGNTGLLQAYHLAQAKRDISLRIKTLENEKTNLEQTLQGLVRDPYIQEKAIRKNLGFTRDNELVFEFK